MAGVFYTGHVIISKFFPHKPKIKTLKAGIADV